jgi:NADPH:quinone reductase-like Zn-dependent oxidoreductase
MMERAALQPGEWVLVVGAGGGVGTAVIQVAKFMGAKVIASAGREDKLQKCWELGADRLINNTTTKISDEVKKLTGGRGVNVVAETVGSAQWSECVRSLAWAGRLVTAGGTTGTNVEIDTRFLYTKRQAIIGSYMGSKADLLKIFTFIQDGKLKPVVGRVMPLEKGAEGQVLMEERLHFGKIVLTV